MGAKTIREEAIKQFLKLNPHLTRQQAIDEMTRWS